MIDPSITLLLSANIWLCSQIGSPIKDRRYFRNQLWAISCRLNRWLLFWVPFYWWLIHKMQYTSDRAEVLQLGNYNVESPRHQGIPKYEVPGDHLYTRWTISIRQIMSWMNFVTEIHDTLLLSRKSPFQDDIVLFRCPWVKKHAYVSTYQWLIHDILQWLQVVNIDTGIAVCSRTHPDVGFSFRWKWKESNITLTPWN